MDHFHYLDDRIYCEEVALDQIAEAVGTPFFCYSEKTLCHHLSVFQQAFAKTAHLICYSVKANSNLAVLDVLARNGAGFDIVSGGELERVRRVGCPGNKIVFSGVGKTREEIRQALDHGVLMFNVESRSELYRIDTLAGESGVKAPVALRINPDVDPKTHPHISTGLKRNKFGIPYHNALDLYRDARRLPHIQLVGLDCHIGSQLTILSPFVDALKRVLTLVSTLKREGIDLQYLDLGGGLGIPYDQSHAPPLPDHYASALLKELEGFDLTLILEPGRVIAGNAGVLVTRVEYIKDNEDKRFVITDAGMNDLMRPALYDAYHGIQPVVRRFGREEEMVDVVGPICESGDFFARDRLLPAFAEGELLAIRSAGAYGFVMSGNYNTRPRAAEVMVRGNRYAIIRRRETLDDLLRSESLFDKGQSWPQPDV
ncbi:MAG: diaminopimelate decarboxylase [Magnetococcales bacterium]|nr:diaminopimelate decarboxylase [Magnetococcales bacterium]HIJ83291.1 diaminopimelate decarboxylase [Magnetococcales bacterium]